MYRIPQPIGRLRLGQCCELSSPARPSVRVLTAPSAGNHVQLALLAHRHLNGRIQSHQSILRVDECSGSAWIAEEATNRQLAESSHVPLLRPHIEGAEGRLPTTGLERTYLDIRGRRPYFATYVRAF